MPTSEDKKNKVPEIVQEITEKPATTNFCPESLNKKELKDVNRNPEHYIEVNMITKSTLVDNFYIRITCRKFTYKNKKYIIDEKKIYLLPSKSGVFILTCFYYEGKDKPRSFKQKNKGITSKALTILYDEKLYADLFPIDDTKYNFFIVFFSIVLLIMHGINLYLLYRGGV